MLKLIADLDIKSLHEAGHLDKELHMISDLGLMQHNL